MSEPTECSRGPAGPDHAHLRRPAREVFRAWTDPDEVAAWFGPEHFDTPRERVASTSASAAGTS